MATRKLDELKQAANSLSGEEKLELAQYLIQRAGAQADKTRKTDLSQFYGKIQFPEDALDYQHRVRAEWDR
jgi:hypothetical protein